MRILPPPRAGSKIALALLLALGCGRAAVDPQKPFHPGHVYGYSPERQENLDDPERDRWQRPEEVVASCLLSDGLTVAEVGSGSGYFTLRLGRAVAPSGRVYAVDIDPGWLAVVKEKSAADPLLAPVVFPTLAPVDGTTLADASVDRVVIVDTLHEIADPRAYLGEVARILRPGGYLIVVDWATDGRGERGPPMSHRITPEVVTSWAAAAGLRRDTSPEPPLPELPEQYLLRFVR